MKKKPKKEFTDKENKIALILIEEMEKWESTTTMSYLEMKKLIKRLSKVKS